MVKLLVEPPEVYEKTAKKPDCQILVLVLLF